MIINRMDFLLSIKKIIILSLIYCCCVNVHVLRASQEYKNDIDIIQSHFLKSEMWRLLKNERARVKNASWPSDQEHKDFYCILSKAQSNKQLDALFVDTNRHGETILDYAFVIARTVPKKGWIGDLCYMSPLKRSRFLEMILGFYPPLVVTDQEGKTPLHKAVMLGKNEIIMLAFHEEVINAQDKNECTPAHYAEYQGALQFLKNAGADFSIKNCFGVAVKDTFTSIFDLYPVPLIDRCEAELCPRCVVS